MSSKFFVANVLVWKNLEKKGTDVLCFLTAKRKDGFGQESFLECTHIRVQDESFP